MESDARPFDDITAAVKGREAAHCRVGSWWTVESSSRRGRVEENKVQKVTERGKDDDGGSTKKTAYLEYVSVDIERL